jgi:hypothetical protein
MDSPCATAAAIGVRRAIQIVSRVHDFEDKTKGKIAPYGVYDVAADAGLVSVVSRP